MQGSVNVNDNIELPLIKEQRKIKSLQMFRKPVQSAHMGDRVGVCVTQFNAKLMERGVICQVGYLQPIYAAVVNLKHIQYYKYAIKSKSKLHISVGHETVMAQITLFKDLESDGSFNIQKQYEYVEELDAKSNTEGNSIMWCLLEFETPILTAPDSILIASKLDLDIHANTCRLAFWGKIQWHTTANSYRKDLLTFWKIYKHKQKEGTVQRLVNAQEIIVQNLFKKESNRQMYVGKQIQLSTGECGRIEGTFGQTSKVKITFGEPLKETTLVMLKEGRLNDVHVMLKYKKYIFNKNLGIIQYLQIVVYAFLSLTGKLGQ